MMNKKFIPLSLMLLVAIFASGCIRTAPPGAVGIKVNLAGDDRGVSDIPIQTGRIWYVPFKETVIIYPTFMQSETYESVVFNDIDGMRIQADVTVAFTLEPEKVPGLYVRYRAPIQDITATYLRRVIRSTLAEVASTMSVDAIYGERKAWLMEEVTRRVREELEPVGFNIDFVAFEGDLVLPSSVIQSIDEKIRATQRAIQAENELRQAEAEANKEVAKAEGEARSAIARAEGEAESILIRAEAEAEANRILVESLGGPEYYVQLKTIEKLGDQIDVLLLPNDTVPLFGVDAYRK